MKLGIGIAAAALVVGCNGCEPTKPAEMPDRWQDAAPDTAEAKRDPCKAAGDNLETACPKLWRSAEYWSSFCHEMIDSGIALCPQKLAKVKSCTEADEVCR